jgi:hypothetical protein
VKEHIRASLHTKMKSLLQIISEYKAKGTIIETSHLVAMYLPFIKKNTSSVKYKTSQNLNNLDYINFALLFLIV